MLRKVFRYDVSAMGRFLVPLYACLLLAALLLGLDTRFLGTASLPIIGIVLTALMILLLVLVFALTFVIILHRFRQNLLGPEGYFTFTLPVSTLTHLLSKLLSALLFAVLAGFVAALAFFLLFSVSARELVNSRTLFEAARLFLSSIRSEHVTLVGQVLLLIVFGLASSILQWFFCLTLGSLWKKHPLVGTLLSYLAVSFLQNQLLHLIFGNMDVAFENVMPASFFVPSLCMELVLGAVYLALTHFILDRHLNLE